jgi:dihydroflavonol-4-reductase
MVSDNRQCFAITGAAGFVGSRLASYLLSSGYKVVAVSKNPYSCENLKFQGAEVRVADVRILEQLNRAFSGVDGVFHIAALFNHPDRTWEDYRDVNVRGTLNVLRAAKACGVQKVVHCSTVGVATEARNPPYDEEIPYSPQPGDRYEVTKAEGELAARDFASANDVRLTVIRPAQVYGPGDRSKVKFYKLVKRGIIVNPGKTDKHLIFIDDLCAAFLKAMASRVADGEIFLIAGQAPIKLKKLVQIAASALKVPPPKIVLPAKPVVSACAAIENISRLLRVNPFVHGRSMDFFTRSVVCDTSKSSRQLGFDSETGVTEGVKMTVEWMRKERLV